MRKRGLYVCLFLLVLLLAGCTASSEEEQADGYQIYYVNAEKTKVISESVQFDESGDLLKQMAEMLFEQPLGEAQTRLLPENVEFLEYQMKDGVLSLNFSQEYQEMDRTEEILIRASMVKTFVQVPDVTSVVILVESDPLMDSYGEEVAPMTADSFVENSGKEINAYQLAHLTLYFANESGDGLVKEERSVYYSTSMPLERVIVEQLLKGPREEGHYPTIPSETKILGVTVADGVCYVNLDNTFSDMALNQQEEIPIYSITNSLVESGSVTEVQIAINGETKKTYREHVSLDQIFHARTDLVEQEETDE
ncbi:MAG: GerMN domain-containing protein [Ruminococcus sp.]|jgi:germination protein M